MKRSPLKRGTSQLKRGELNKRSKTNKHRPIANIRINHDLGPVLCTVCQWLYGDEHSRLSCSTHEVYFDGSTYMRNTSRDYKAQEKVCMEHDEEIHRSDHVLDRRLKEKHQRRIMDEYGITVDEFRNIFNGNWLTEIKED